MWKPEQEGVARGGRRRSADRGVCQAAPTRWLRISRSRFPRKQRLLETPSSPSGWRRCSADGERALGAAGREANPDARQAADGEDTARVISQRADEGDPEGARRRGGQGRAGRLRTRSREQASEGAARRPPTSSRSCARCRRCRRKPPSVRNYLDWLVWIPWTEVEDQEATSGCASRSSMTTTTASKKVKERIVEYLAVQAARQQADRPDPVPRRTARRRQDLARQVDRQGDRPRVRARLARRRARRGRDPRPSAHLRRRDAREDHPVDAQGQDLQSAVPARRGRQDGRRFPRRSVVGVARSARPRAEPYVQRSLSGGRLRSLQRDVHHHGEHARTFRRP